MPYKIHPGIGVARVGNSSSWFVGPETVREPVAPDGSYRDAECRIKRQAARFRIWRYDLLGNALDEVTTDYAEIIWTVQLGRPDAIPPPLQLSGAGKKASFAKVTLPDLKLDVSYGTIETDDEGRLIVRTSKLPDTLDPFDGTCDGWVTAKVKAEGQAQEDVLGSWIVCAPPDYAPAIRPAMSAYDRVCDILALPVPAQPSFTRDIYPILRSANDLSFAFGFTPLFLESALPLLADPLSGGSTRAATWNELKARASQWQVGGGFQVGTRQSKMMNRWVAGTFLSDLALLDEPIAKTPAELDRGPLDHCHPSWPYEVPGIFDASLYAEPHRLDLGAVEIGATHNPNDWRIDASACQLIWAAQVTVLPGSVTEITVGLFDDRGFVVRNDGELEYDESCGALQPKSEASDNVMIPLPGKQNDILVLLGGGDGGMIVMTPTGPVRIGPWNPETRRLAKRIGDDARRLGALVKKKRAKKKRARPKEKEKHRAPAKAHASRARGKRR